MRNDYCRVLVDEPQTARAYGVSEYDNPQMKTLTQATPGIGS